MNIFFLRFIRYYYLLVFLFVVHLSDCVVQFRSMELGDEKRVRVIG